MVEFNPINPLKAHGHWLLEHPDHRKILIIDGKVAIAGGVNISSVYQAVLPSASDFSMALDAMRYNYSELLKAGVKVYEYRNAWLHAKTAVIDGVWSTVGSTNLDYWSLSSIDEVNAVILSREFAIEMEKMFARDLEKSDPTRFNGKSGKKDPCSQG